MTALANHLQLNVDLAKAGSKGPNNSKSDQDIGSEITPSDASPPLKQRAEVFGGGSWSDFIAVNGSSPPTEAPAKKGRKPRGSAPVKTKSRTPPLAELKESRSTGLTSTPMSGDVSKKTRGTISIQDPEEQEEFYKINAEKKRMDIKLKNLTRDTSAEVKKHLDLEAVQEATMMEAALKKSGKRGRRIEQEAMEVVSKPADNPDLSEQRKSPIYPSTKEVAKGRHSSERKDGREVEQNKMRRPIKDQNRRAFACMLEKHQQLLRVLATNCACSCASLYQNASCWKERYQQLSRCFS